MRSFTAQAGYWGDIFSIKGMVHFWRPGSYSTCLYCWKDEKICEDKEQTVKSSVEFFFICVRSKTTQWSFQVEDCQKAYIALHLLLRVPRGLQHVGCSLRVTTQFHLRVQLSLKSFSLRNDSGANASYKSRRFTAKIHVLLHFWELLVVFPLEVNASCRLWQTEYLF